MRPHPHGGLRHQDQPPQAAQRIQRQGPPGPDLPQDTELAVRTSAGRLLLVHSTQISEKQTKTTAGVAVVTLKKNQTITDVRPADQLELANPHRYRVRTLPAAGALLRSEDLVEQTSLGE